MRAWSALSAKIFTRSWLNAIMCNPRAGSRFRPYVSVRAPAGRSLEGFPFGLPWLELGMRHQQMPDHRLQRLAMRRYLARIHGRDDDARIGNPGRMAAVT